MSFKADKQTFFFWNWKLSFGGVVFVLCCAVLCCAVLCCAARCAMLCCAVLCCAVLCSAQCCAVCSVLCCAVLSCILDVLLLIDPPARSSFALFTWLIARGAVVQHRTRAWVTQSWTNTSGRILIISWSAWAMTQERWTHWWIGLRPRNGRYECVGDSRNSHRLLWRFCREMAHQCGWSALLCVRRMYCSGSTTRDWSLLLSIQLYEVEVNWDSLMWSARWFSRMFLTYYCRDFFAYRIQTLVSRVWCSSYA